MRGLLVAILAVCSSTDVLACPLDEGGVTIHPGSLSRVTVLPSHPSLYFLASDYDHHLEIESNGRPVSFEEVPFANAVRIDIDLEAGPLVVRSVASRTFTYEYRVVPGLAIDRSARVDGLSATDYYTDFHLMSDAGLWRIEWADGYVEAWERSGWWGPWAEVYASRPHAAFRVVGLFADRTRAVLWDPTGDLGVAAVRAADRVRTWLVPPATIGKPASRRVTVVLIGALVLAAVTAFGLVRARRIAAASATSVDR